MYYETEDGNITISSYTNITNETKIKIPSTIGGKKVTRIGMSAFEGRSNLTNIEIPEGVTSIGMRAFKGCTSLTSVKLPDGLTDLGDEAFSGCTMLTGISLPDTLTYCGERTLLWL